MTHTNVTGAALAQDYTAVQTQQNAVRETAMFHLEELYDRVGRGDINAFRTLEDIRDGRRRLWESQTTSDFPALTSALMGRRLKAQWMSWPLQYRRYIPIRSSPITDFRQVYGVGVNRDANSATFGQIIAEGASFGYSTFADTIEGYRAYKYIEGYKTSWELRLNDDLGGLGQIVPLMVDDQVYVQEKFAVTLHADANGPHASLYTSGRGNIIIDNVTDPSTPVTNPLLSMESLEAAFAQLKSAKDVSGRPIMVNGAVLVVGTAALEMLAMKLLNTIETRETNGTFERVSRSVLPAFDIVYNPYIGEVVTTNLDTSWWLFPRPVANPSRTWAEMGFLAGMETPQVYMKAPNTLTLGGQPVSGIGDFNTWSMEYAVATAFGGRQLADYQVTVASDGTES